MNRKVQLKVNYNIIDAHGDVQQHCFSGISTS